MITLVAIKRKEGRVDTERQKGKETKAVNPLRSGEGWVQTWFTHMAKLYYFQVSYLASPKVLYFKMPLKPF